MYLGHSLLAIAVVGLAGLLLDLDTRRTLLVAALAGAFGFLPDVDMWRTILVFLREGPQGIFPTEEHLFVHSWVVHRTLTHSMIVGVGVAAATGLFTVARERTVSPDRAVANGLLGFAVLALMAFSWRTGGILSFVTMGLFLAAALAVAYTGFERGATPTEVTAAAALGLLTHPLGDLWMGRPPAFLYPLSAEPPIGSVRFSTDRVLHFIVAIGVEVALLWACLLVVAALIDRQLRSFLSPLAVGGLLYAAALGFVLPPTFTEAYQFVTGLFAVSLFVAIAVLWADWRALRRLAVARASVNGVVAFTLALVSYAVAYALLT